MVPALLFFGCPLWIGFVPLHTTEDIERIGMRPGMGSVPGTQQHGYREKKRIFERHIL